MTAEVLIVAFAALAIGVLLGWLLGARPGAAARAELSNAAERAQRLEIEVGRLRGFEGEFAAAQAQIDLLRPMRLELEKERDEALRRGEAAREDLAALSARHAEQTREHGERLQELKEVRDSLPLHFGEVAKRALDEAQTKFLQRADERFKESEATAGQGLKALLAPVTERLQRYEEGVAKVEAERRDAFGDLKGQIEAMRVGTERVSGEAAKLVNALRDGPKKRGSWGELQLKNLLESCGLSQHTDFRMEVSVETEDGRLRPDAVVKIPGGRSLVIDSKVSLNAYQDAVDALDDEQRGICMTRHVASMKNHVNTLGAKAYQSQFESVDYVIMFVPGEQFVSAALEHDPNLWDYAFEKNVLVATPANLIAILRTVAAVWRQERLADQAAHIATLGKELHGRLATMAGHVTKLGRNLELANGAYNQFVGSLESQVLTQARRFEALDVVDAGKRIEATPMVETAPRALVKLAELGTAVPAD